MSKYVQKHKQLIPFEPYFVLASLFSSFFFTLQKKIRFFQYKVEHLKCQNYHIYQIDDEPSTSILSIYGLYIMQFMCINYIYMVFLTFGRIISVSYYDVTILFSFLFFICHDSFVSNGT